MLSCGYIMDNPVCVCAYAFGLSERGKKRHMYRLRALTQQEKRERELFSLGRDDDYEDATATKKAYSSGGWKDGFACFGVSSSCFILRASERVKRLRDPSS